MLASAVIVFTGLGLGWWLYGKRQRKTAEEKDVLEVAQPAFSSCWKTNISWMKFTRRPSFVSMPGPRALCDFLDRWIWGGAVLLVTWVTLGLSWLYRFTDDFVVNLGFDAGCETLREGGGAFQMHTGRVQTYLRVIGVALVVLVLFLIWGRKHEPALADHSDPRPAFGGIVVAGLGAERKRRLARGLALASASWG
jgi:NADH-quinone oxidoreductase subunit L